MAARRILQIENPDDKKILKTRCHPIKTFSPALKQLAADMFETMHAANGVGLAAPQIGISQRIAVIWIPPEVEEREDGTRIEVAPEESFVLINPQIIKVGAGEDIGQEGCLSLPGWYGDVPRHSWVTVEYQDPIPGREQWVGVRERSGPGCIEIRRDDLNASRTDLLPAYQYIMLIGIRSEVRNRRDHVGQAQPRPVLDYRRTQDMAVNLDRVGVGRLDALDAEDVPGPQLQ
jgi:peptide deformylase